MRISQRGLNLIKEFEGCKLRAYLDVAGIPTIGYGHTKGVYRGQEIDQVTADLWLSDDLWYFEEHLSDDVKVPLTQNQFDALVSFSYNTGDLSGTTLLKLLNASDYSGAGSQILRWNRAGGRVVPGLVRRREAEYKLWSTP